jgi:aminoglycoside phosphotransferase family enzyme/predicted kinase
MDLQAPSRTAVDRTLVDALRDRLAADTGHPVSLVETHISWVLLTEQLAYKLKKPVQLPFVDFSTLALRKYFCEEELRLNRRLAPALYLGVVPVCGTSRAPHVAGDGETVDYAVCMRRFASGALLGEHLAAGTLRPEHLEGLAGRLAEFHQRAPIATTAPRRDATERVLAPVLGVLQELRLHIDAARVVALEGWLRAQAEALRETFSARQRDGQVRECHGDLHLGNAVLIDGEATAFDCIEFEPELRRIDVLSDVAFLTMDLKANGRGDLAFRFLDAYLQNSGDYAGVPVLRFYEVYRALVRALVGCLRAGSGEVRAAVSGPDYLACAERMVQDAGGAPRLLITHGVSGSGKSTVALQLLAASGALRLRSDVERKRLFGLAALERSANRMQIYGAGATMRTFERLARCARTALRAGYPVIVDAAFLRSAERDVFRALARELRVPFTILHCTAGEARLRERVAARNTAGNDASEADLNVLDRQQEYCEPLSPEERAFAIEVSTDEPTDAAALYERILRKPVAPRQSRSGRAAEQSQSTSRRSP